MAPTTATPNEEPRRRPLQAYNSFPRPDSYQTTNELRNRASTIGSSDASGNSTLRIETENAKANSAVRSVNEGNTDEIEGGKDSSKDGEAQPSTPADFDELPVELISLCDTFIDSLSAKVHPTPPTVDRLSSLFQDFYVLASTHINTHISMLSSRQNRQPSVTSLSSLSSRHSKRRAGSTASCQRSIPDDQAVDHQQLLTPEELTERKRARKLLEKKGLALEEAVERRVTEKIYDRIFQHRSTSDEAADSKLRSKTAALSVVGIGLTDLGVDFGVDPSEPEKAAEKEKEVRAHLEDARVELHAMNDEHCPLGKLTRLKKAHKCIVDTLAAFHPSSSADEILPLLIYTLITSDPEEGSIISNFYFIQRFRSESKIDGEAAYCLTNLEAAIAFLETVDLSQLRADEVASGPPKEKSSRPVTPGGGEPKADDEGEDESAEKDDKPAPFPKLSTATPSQALSHPKLSPALIAPPAPGTSGVEASLRPSPTHRNRRLSELLQPATALGNAGKEAVLNTADKGLTTIGNSLGESYNFLVGKLRERQEVTLPRTLDDARRLVGTPPPGDDDSASASASATSSLIGERAKDDKLVSLISGRAPQVRDRSVESTRSGSSSIPGSKKPEATGRPGASPLTAATEKGKDAAGQVAEGIRMLSSSFNPLGRFSAMRAGFSRSTPGPSTQLPTQASLKDRKVEEAAESEGGEVRDLATAFPDLTPVLPPKSGTSSPVKEVEVKKKEKKVDPPVQRFMDVRSPGDLKLSEVVELLRDYRRLAGALKERGAFKD